MNTQINKSTTKHKLKKNSEKTKYSENVFIYVIRRQVLLIINIINLLAKLIITHLGIGFNNTFCVEHNSIIECGHDKQFQNEKFQ